MLAWRLAKPGWKRHGTSALYLRPLAALGGTAGSVRPAATGFFFGMALDAAAAAAAEVGRVGDSGEKRRAWAWRGAARGWLVGESGGEVGSEMEGDGEGEGTAPSPGLGTWDGRWGLVLVG